MTWQQLSIGSSRSAAWNGRRWLEERWEHGHDHWFCRRTRHADLARTPIVMVHGLVVSGSYFDPLLDRLDIPNPIYVPDLPGFGRSSSDRRARSIADMADSLAGWMDAHRLADAILIANSLGCQIATCLAAHRPELAAGLVLISPTLDPIATSIPHIALRAATDIPRERQSLWHIWLGDLGRSGIRRALATLSIAIADDQQGRLPQVVQPSLVVGGEDDPIVTAAWVRTTAQLMPHARAIVIPGAPHAINYSAPRDLVRLIRIAITFVETRQVPGFMNQ